MSLRRAYRPDIDGLRALAVLFVIGFHVAPGRLHGGFTGVDVFFVISGYLISGILFADLDAGTFSFATFYSRRARRILGALVVVLLACFAAGWFLLGASGFAELGKEMAAGAGFAANLLFWRRAGYFDDTASTRPLMHLWSLGVEEQFYLAWPLLVFAAWRLRVSRLALVALVLLASFAAAVATVGHDPVAAFYSPLLRVWELMVGALLACLHQHRPQATSRYADLQSAAGLGFIFAGLLLIGRYATVPGWWALLPTVGTFLAISAGPEAWANRRLLAHPVAVWVGLISYPLYLWHWPLLAIPRGIGLGFDSPAQRGLAVLASVALAALTFRLLELPIRGGAFNRAKVAGLAAGLVVCIALGVATVVLGGLPRRAVNQDPRVQFLERYVQFQVARRTAPTNGHCNFYDDRDPSGVKAALPADCAAAGLRGTELIWGDSHAGSLAPGIGSILPPGVGLAQVTTSGCAPKVEDDGALADSCAVSNRFAAEQIRRLKPDRVLVAQRYRHLETDWEALADFAHAAGAREVVLFGPLPQWHPSLPLAVARCNFEGDRSRVSCGLDQDVLAVDRELSRRYARSPKLTFVSLIDRLCDARGCQGNVPGDPQQMLMSGDYGHLTPQGSAYVARTFLANLAREPGQ